MSEDSKRPVIAIDGPAGAGKSTVSKMLARDLGFRYLDTGAMYRALALKASRLGISRRDAKTLAEVADQTQIAFADGEPQRVLLDGEDVTSNIRSLEIGDLASAISTHPEVRRALVRCQQAMIRAGGVVLEGRDATTVIAPEAEVKVYLTASLEERARRRALEMRQSGLDGEFEDVRAQISVRDHRDITREDSPLRVASDAVLVECGGLTPAEVVARIRALLPNSQAM